MAVRCSLHVSFTRFLVGLSWRAVQIVLQDGPTRPLRAETVHVLEVSLGPLLITLSRMAPGARPVEAPSQAPPPFPYSGRAFR